MKPADWHARFSQQARWTQDLRRYLFKQTNILTARSVLEVGCGTGAVLGTLPDEIPLQYGLDIANSHLSLAMRNFPDTILIQGDAHTLPYQDNFFDLTFCHFLLLWVADPAAVIAEMCRVTRPGGFVLVLAEPDFGGRIDYPETIVDLGKWQTASLETQGVDPNMGRKLARIFHRAGLENVETGVLGGQWSGSTNWDAWEIEWKVLESDLKEKSPQMVKILKAMKALDRAAYENGERVLFVPTFYAWGKVS
jgi:ubiquinone/menaquinone biosynthesis C-methylase UbiE